MKPGFLLLNWHKPIPVLLYDSTKVEAGIQDLYRRNPEPALAVVLTNADHFHNTEAAQDGYKVFIGNNESR